MDLFLNRVQPTRLFPPSIVRQCKFEALVRKNDKASFVGMHDLILSTSIPGAYVKQSSGFGVRLDALSVFQLAAGLSIEFGVESLSPLVGRQVAIEQAQIDHCENFVDRQFFASKLQQCQCGG